MMCRAQRKKNKKVGPLFKKYEQSRTATADIHCPETCKCGVLGAFIGHTLKKLSPAAAFLGHKPVGVTVSRAHIVLHRTVPLMSSYLKSGWKCNRTFHSGVQYIGWTMY